MDIDTLAKISKQVSSTRSRKAKIVLVGELLRRVSDEELPIATNFLAGRMRQGKIGLGPAMVRRTLEKLPPILAAKPTGLLEVDQLFSEIAATRGRGSNQRRQELLATLLHSTNTTSQNFLAGLILGEVRQGALEGILIESMAFADGTDSDVVRRAVMLTGDIAEVASVSRSEGEAGLRQFEIELFRPVQPMLAETSEDVTQAIHQIGSAVFEYKLDGVRIQVHKSGEEVRVFTRHLNDVTACVPEIASQVRGLPIQQAILDGEVLAIRSDGWPHPFQTTMKRFGRSQAIHEIESSLPLSSYFFDCLMLEGQSMLDESTRRRHEALADCVPNNLIIPRIITGSSKEASDFLAAATNAGHEGVMAKELDANYAAGGRGQNWLKIKPSHTLDLVVLAAEWGSGRRRGYLSNLHLGARDANSNEFIMIGKTFKGLTDQTLTWQTEQLLSREIQRDKSTVHVRPELVVEIAFNEVQTSPHYASGYALRFARVKSYRKDKGPEQADTIATIAELHQKRAG